MTYRLGEKDSVKSKAVEWEKLSRRGMIGPFTPPKDKLGGLSSLREEGERTVTTMARRGRRTACHEKNRYRAKTEQNRTATEVTSSGRKGGVHLENKKGMHSAPRGRKKRDA